MPDETALDVLQRCDGATSIDALVDDLVNIYGAERAEIVADVTELLSGLLDKRVLAL